MKRVTSQLLAATIALALSAVGTVPLLAQSQIAAQAVCPKPGASCDAPYKHFAPYELPFRLPPALAANTPVRSAPFYAVVLKRFTGSSATACDGGEWTIAVERERQRLQKQFPNQKVFATKLERTLRTAPSRWCPCSQQATFSPFHER